MKDRYIMMLQFIGGFLFFNLLLYSEKHPIYVVDFSANILALFFAFFVVFLWVFVTRRNIKKGVWKW